MSSTRTRPAPAARPGPRTRRSRGRGALPVVLVLPAVAGLAFLIVPLAGLILKASWGTLFTQLADPAVLDALWLSLQAATVATAACLVCGVPLAWLLARGELPGRKYLRALVAVPLALPPVVGGLALLLVFGRNGSIGQYLQSWFGFSLPFTFAGVVVAEAFMAMPFMVIAVDGALRGSDQRYEEAAATLGASRWLIFRHITLPLVAPGVGVGAALCWARALGEFGATVTFNGRLTGVTKTMPLTIYLEKDNEAAIMLSLVLLAVCVIVFVCLRDKWISLSAA